MTIIAPALHRYPEEAAILGRMVLGYTELEFMHGVITAYAHDADRDDMLRALYRTQSEASRRKVCDALLRAPLSVLKLEGQYSELKGCLKHCGRIRNQYAHCQWGDTEKGLFFADLDATATNNEGFKVTFRHICLELLKLQEAYFVHTRMLLLYLENELLLRKGRVKSHVWTKPKAHSQPILYNPDVTYP